MNSANGKFRRTAIVTPCPKCGRPVRLSSPRSRFIPAGPRPCPDCVARIYGGQRLRLDVVAAEGVSNGQ
jgi:hypothetical protein